MAEIKWIKITTNIFDDEKIKIIDTYPARDEILVIWFKLLALAGKTNQNGMLFMSNKIPYTIEMLSAVFNREINSVRLALNTFEQFGMIEVEENEIISITNWDKHQNIDGMDKIREQNRIRQQKHRDKQRTLLDCNVTSRYGNGTEEEKEEEKEEENIKTNKNSTRKQVFSDIISNYTDDEELIKAINDFILMRKSIKATMTDRALSMMLNKLNGMVGTNSEKIDILNQSTMNSWKGIFPIKKDYVKPKPKGNASHNFGDRGVQYSNDELEKRLGIRS